MKKDYRYHGIDRNGKNVQGIVVARNLSEAKKEINKIKDKLQLTITKIEPKRKFFYTITLPTGKKIKGKQEAFTKQEVARALAAIGYKHAKIEPVWFDIALKPPTSSILMFVNLSSFMLKEKMSYDRILRMLAEEEKNPVLRETLKKIEAELKKGKEGTEVFKRYEDVFGKFPAYMLGLATKSGNMAEVYDATAKFMERDQEYKKSLRQAILTPMLTVIFMIIAVGYYVVVIFPKTARLFQRFKMKLPPMTAFTLKLSDWLAINWWWLLLLLIGPILILWLWWRTPKGRIWRDKFLISLPLIGHLLHKSSIEIFFRVFSAIYSGAENNIETLTASAEACRNAYIEHGVKEITIPLMLKEGKSLVPALAQANVFNKGTLSRLKAGSETGNILQSAKQIAAFYEKETTYKMQNLIMSIQGVINVFIAIVITALTIVSSEIAMIQPPTPGM